MHPHSILTFGVQVGRLVKAASSFSSSLSLSLGAYNSAQAPRRTMKIELTPDNATALVRYAELAGHTPAEFLNRYLTDNMVALFENPRSGELESHLAKSQISHPSGC
jgi:hypothetical protein